MTLTLEYPPELRAGLHGGPGCHRRRVSRMSGEGDVTLAMQATEFFPALCGSGAPIGIFYLSLSVRQPGIRAGTTP